MSNRRATASRLAGDLSYPDGPETTLLLTCARNRLDLETTKRIKTIVEEAPLDWTLLIRRAIFHGLTPLLAWNLARSCADSLPAELADGLRDWLAQNRARNLALAQEVLTIANLLEKQNIPAIPFKGPVLAKALFGDLALRQSGDLDFLVPERHISSALDVFGSLGYQLGPGQGGAYRRYLNNLVLERPDQMILAELHWDLTPRIMAVRFDINGLWMRARKIPFEDRSVLSLSCEDYLIFLCVHGSKHFWSRLKWICDIHEFLDAHTAIDWKRCLELSRNQGCERMVLLGLTLAEDMLETELPEPVRDRIYADPVVRQQAQQMRADFFHDGARQPDIFEGFQPSLLSLRERSRDKLLYCWRNLTTPHGGHLGIVSLPRFLWFLYVPIKILCDYGWRPLRLLARPREKALPKVP